MYVIYLTLVSRMLPLHTPNGSPRMKSVEEERWNSPSSPIIPVPSSSTPFANNNQQQYENYGTPSSINDSSSPEEYNKDLDDQLTKLLKKKEKVMYCKMSQV